MSLTCVQPKPCVPKIPTKETYPPATDAFEQCVGDYTWKWDGVRLTRNRARNTPDGTYSQFTITDGCVTDVGYCPEPTYTPPYCNPNPTPCQEGSGGGTDIVVSPALGNSLSMSSRGLFARTYLRAGAGVAITGTGNSIDPYTVTISNTSTGGVRSVVGEKGIAVRTSDSAVTYVGLNPTGIVAGTYGNMTLNDYGQITNISIGDTPAVSAGAGLVATATGDTITIGHETVNIDNQVRAGAFNLSISTTGHIIDTDQVIMLGGGTYKLGAYNVTLNTYGSITDIQQSTDVVAAAGIFATSDNKTVTYDESGRITNVVATGTLPDSNTLPPLPIRDFYKFIAKPTIASAEIIKESYGTDILVGEITPTTFTIPLLDYILDKSQITVNGATAALVSGRSLVISYPVGSTRDSSPAVTVTVVYRG